MERPGRAGKNVHAGMSTLRESLSPGSLPGFHLSHATVVAGKASAEKSMTFLLVTSTGVARAGPCRGLALG